MRRQGYRYQRTIARPVEVQGVGFLTGATIRLGIKPAPIGSGVIFLRVDLPECPAIPAQVDQVTGTQRRTTLGQAPARVELVEHVLAALAGLRIDNCYVELNGSEPPGLDGSAQGFVQVLSKAGVALQPARREIWSVDRPVSVTESAATLTLYPEPHDRLRVSYLLDYGLRTPIGLQRHTHDITPETFCNSIGASRTFLLEAEAEQLKRQGLGSRTTPGDLIVFGPRGPIDNRLRFADEPARHKILDLLGDLSLLGHDLRGHVIGYRSGHSLNVGLVRRLVQQMKQAQPRERQRAA